ncbi:MAG: nuclear transport factor 2 family protein [Gemmatimonadota bacterium]
MRRLAVLLPTLVLLGCQPGATPLTDADIAAIRGLGEVYAGAMVAGDAEALAAVYAASAVEMPPGAPATMGRDAIRERYAAGMRSGFTPATFSFSLTPVEITGVDGLAYDRGTYTWTGTPPGVTGPVSESGKYLVVVRRQEDGSWLWTSVIWNSDTPPPAPVTQEPAAE